MTTIRLIVLSGCLVFSGLTVGCERDERPYHYDSLVKNLESMDGKLPAFAPKDEEFFINARKSFSKQRDKYLSVIESDDYILWDNSKSIQNLINLAKQGKRLAKNDNPIDEVKVITELLGQFIDNYGQKGGNFVDSHIMFARGLVDSTYTKDAAKLGSDITYIGSCVDTILYRLENSKTVIGTTKN